MTALARTEARAAIVVIRRHSSVVQSRSPSYFQMGRRDIGSHIIATGGYPLWYEIALPLGSVFAWRSHFGTLPADYRRARCSRPEATWRARSGGRRDQPTGFLLQRMSP